jgi:phospho-N-acetylmuramoyl-pentapeptide-transferase
MHSTLEIILKTHAIDRIVILGLLSFLLSMLITPIYTGLAYRYSWWKKPRTTAATGETATVVNHLQAEKLKHHVPTMAGVIFVISVTIVTIVANLSRSQTWLPIAAFFGAALVGLLDDIINLRGHSQGVAGLSSKLKFLLITLVALIGGFWFYFKLGVVSIHIPLMWGGAYLGWGIIPLFIIVVVATANAVNITDGLDGLAGGLASTAFGIYAIIATLEGRTGVAAFCLCIVGALLSYTWFNIYPARFFMGDVGSFALGTALGVVAMITNTVVLLPLIGIVFVVEAGSSLLQITSKRLRHGKKIFKAAPIHHHFEANGWPETKITMRFWVIGQVASVAGLIVFLIGKYL